MHESSGRRHALKVNGYGESDEIVCVVIRDKNLNGSWFKKPIGFFTRKVSRIALYYYSIEIISRLYIDEH